MNATVDLEFRADRRAAGRYDNDLQFLGAATKASDVRYQWYSLAYGGGAGNSTPWTRTCCVSDLEADTVPTDLEAWDHAIEVEAAQRQSMKTFMAAYQKSISRTMTNTPGTHHDACTTRGRAVTEPNVIPIKAAYSPEQQRVFDDTCTMLVRRGFSTEAATIAARGKAEGFVIPAPRNATRARANGAEVPGPSREPDGAPAADPPAAHVNIECAADIEPEPINWLWPGWLARGKMHVLAGTAGTGKTTLALAMIATTTTGGRWPDGFRAPHGRVLMWSGEDDPADTLVPRLIAMGADLARIHFIGGVSDLRGLRAFDPASDVRLLAEQMALIEDITLLIVDPIVSAVALDSHKNSEVRRGLQPLVDLAAAHNCALIGITHYTKGTTGRDPLERVTGSLAFGALARIVLGTAKPTEEGARRRLVRAKSNIGPDGGGFEYELEQVDLDDRPGLSASRLLWRDAIAGTARELLAEVETEPEENHPALGAAKAFLRTILADGPMLAKAIRTEADEAGHAWATVRRAQDELEIVVEKERVPAGKWLWRLNPQGELPGGLVPGLGGEGAH